MDSSQGNEPYAVDLERNVDTGSRSISRQSPSVSLNGSRSSSRGPSIVTPPLSSRSSIDHQIGNQGSHPPNSYWDDLQVFGCSDDSLFPIARSERLYRLNLTYLFNELMKIKAQIQQSTTTDETNMKLLGDLLHRYSEAIRDYEYINQLNRLPDHSSRIYRKLLEDTFESHVKPAPPASSDPEKLSTTTSSPDDNKPYNVAYLTIDKKTTQTMDPIRKFLLKVLPRAISWPPAEKKRKGDYSRSKRDHTRNGDPERYSNALDRLARFSVGMLGALWLIAPFLIMALHQTFNTTLITVCVSVVLFALSISLVLETDNKETITATATYAAVLVVFVGTSTSKTGSGG